MAGEPNPQDPLMPVDMPAGRETKVKVWIGDGNHLHVGYPRHVNRDVAETINDVLIPLMLSNVYKDKAPEHTEAKDLNRTYQLPDGSKSAEILKEIRLALAEYNLSLIKDGLESQAGTVKKLLQIYSDPRIKRRAPNEEYVRWPSHDEWTGIIRKGLENAMLDPMRSIAVSEAIVQELEVEEFGQSKALTTKTLVKWLEAQMLKERPPGTPLTDADYALIAKTFVKAGSFKGMGILVAALNGLEKVGITGDHAWFAADQIMLAVNGREKDGSRIIGYA